MSEEGTRAGHWMQQSAAPYSGAGACTPARSAGSAEAKCVACTTADATSSKQVAKHTHAVNKLLGHMFMSRQRKLVPAMAAVQCNAGQ